MPIQRRTFLQTLGLAATGTVMMGPWSAGRLIGAPQKQADRNFIFCYFNGGWDQLLSLDPRYPGQFPDSKIRTSQIQLGYDRLPAAFNDGTPLTKNIIKPSGSNIEFGPAMDSFAKHYDVSCVVRGVMMDTVAHDIGRRYFITGEMPAGLSAKGSSWGTRIVAQQGELSQIPNLVLQVETYNNGLPTFATGLKATSTYDLVSTLKKGPDALSNELQKFLDDYRASAENCDPTQLNEDGLMSMVQLSQHKAKSLVDSNLSKYFDFLNKGDATMVDIAKRYGITSTTSPGAQAALAYQAVKEQLAQCITIELARGLDTHVDNWNTDQPNLLHEGFKALSTLVTDLKDTKHPTLVGKKLIDTTTIVCFSEFARTPLINSKDGRDHFLVSSCLLIGAGVPHNEVIGATADIGMSAFQIDANTGQPVKSGGAFLNPQNILASILKGAGYKHDALREKPLPCLIVT